jgi:hypothetical protein
MATAPPRPGFALRTVPVRGVAHGVGLEVLARESGLHPDLVRRLVRLGLVDDGGGTHARPLFPSEAAARLAMAVRLRRDLGVNYSGAVLACRLLARIDELEARLRR